MTDREPLVTGLAAIAGAINASAHWRWWHFRWWPRAPLAIDPLGEVMRVMENEVEPLTPDFWRALWTRIGKSSTTARVMLENDIRLVENELGLARPQADR